MQKSMDTAVSAIKAQQTKLDVTANNIANVNTVGFKKSRTLFTNALNQAMRTAGAPTTNRGGVNPSTVGFGVQVSSIDTIHTQGMLSTTGRALDLAIQGEGFFTVSDGGDTYYTRNGALNFSPIDGSLTLANGMRVMGYPVDPATGLIDKNAGLQPLSIPTGQDTMVQATSKVDFSGNISSSLNVGETVSIPFTTYDSLGTKHEFNIEIEITGTGEASWTATHANGLPVTGGTGTLEFDSNGKIENSTGGPISISPIGAEKLTVEMDFSKVTMLDKSTDFSMKSQDGMPAGTVQGISVTSGGILTVTYSNGMSKDVGALAIAEFDNPAGLMATEDSLFAVTSNSGLPIMSAGGESNTSNVLAGYLEGSNVDVSEELTDMIKTQRAYQMSTKVVTTSDEMITDLMSIKR